MPLTVQEVLNIAREWIEAEAGKDPAFRGAHLMGSVPHMQPDAVFPSYKDVDIHILVDGAKRMRDIDYRGVYLECADVNVERYRTPELVLADPEIAPNLAADSILSDPTGMLSDLRYTVVRDFAQRRWLEARCDAEKQWAMGSWEEASQQEATEVVFTQMGWMVNFLAGLIAIAHLTPPTHRRCLIVMGGILREQGRTDILEAVLGLLGFADLDRSTVTALLTDCGAQFDLATAVNKTPVPFQFKLRPYVRPYVVEGAQEMIAEGHYREAMMWVALFMMVSTNAIRADAHGTERAAAEARWDRFLRTIDWAEVDDLPVRIDRAKAVMDEVFTVADRIAGL